MVLDSVNPHAANNFSILRFRNKFPSIKGNQIIEFFISSRHAKNETVVFAELQYSFSVLQEWNKE